MCTVNMHANKNNTFSASYICSTLHTSNLCDMCRNNKSQSLKETINIYAVKSSAYAANTLDQN